MKVLGLVLATLGLMGSLYCWRAAAADEVYFRALRGYERYPGNVLYLQELKMAEPRHMLLLAGAWAAAPAGLVGGSLCLALSVLLATAGRRQDHL